MQNHCFKNYLKNVFKNSTKKVLLKSKIVTNQIELVF